MSETTIHLVEGMTCDGCARSVTRAVQRLDPGASVAVDLDRGRVTVRGGTEAVAVGAAIDAAGFTWKGVEAA